MTGRSLDQESTYLGLAMLGKNSWCNLVNLAYKAEHWIFGKVILFFFISF